MRTPTCHPDRAFCARDKCRPCYERDRRALHPGRPRVRTPEQRTRRNAADRARAARAREVTGERFPVAPLLAFAAGRGNPPLTAEELSFRVGAPVPDELTDVGADHIAVALGYLPADIWTEQWEDFDGPCLDAPTLRAGGVYIAFPACICRLHGPAHNARPV